MNTLAFALENEVMPYDWGHPAAIRDFLGSHAECPAIQAEYWMGAHPKASSKLCLDGVSHRLYELIEADATRYLGQAAVEQGWSSLPFLFKLLAAKKALSIQCHPSLVRAAEGFALENAKGLDISAPNRNYKDGNHKPEIIVALSDFRGLCGFREAAKIGEDFARIAIIAKASGQTVAAQRFDMFAGKALRGDLAGLTQSILELGEFRQQTVGCLCEIAQRETEDRFQLLARTADDYPGDSGLLFFLVLELLQLRPGESFYAPAGVLHAYIEGFGMELMANSDNVLRGGLTSKHIDVAELMANLDLNAAAGVLTPLVRGKVRTYSAPAAEFRLDLITSCAWVKGSQKAEIWMCIDGAGELEIFGGSGDTQTVKARKGRSYYLIPGAHKVFVTGDVEMARAYIP